MEDRAALISEIDTICAAPTSPGPEREAALTAQVRAWRTSARAFVDEALAGFIEAEQAWHAVLGSALPGQSVDTREYERCKQAHLRAAAALDTAQADHQAAMRARSRLDQARKRWRQAEAMDRITARAAEKAAQRAELARTAATRTVVAQHRAGLLTRAAQMGVAAATMFGQRPR